MPYTNFPNGITSFGVPTIGTGPFIPTGNIFFVSSVIGSNGNAGVAPSPTQPLATIAFALTLCTANNGDIIYCMPGHAESSAAASAINLNVAGVTIIGLGSGSVKPTLTLTTLTTATIAVTAANVTLANFNIVGDIAALVTAISVTAPNFNLQNCNFSNQVVGTHILTQTILTSALATGLIINNCSIHYETATTPSTSAIRLIGVNDAQITNFYIGGSFTASAIVGATTASLGILIQNGTIVNTSTSTAGWINMITASTGNINNITGYSGAPTGNLATIITVATATGLAITQCFGATGAAATNAGAFLGTVST